MEESFPINDAVQSLAEKGFFVHDGFLSAKVGGETDEEDAAFADDLLTEMLSEGSNMLGTDKLERDITRLGDGEYAARIVGGEKYVDCPRITEYVVSLTRHLPPLLNKAIDALSDASMTKLDATASMGTLRWYERKTRIAAQALLAQPEDDDVSIDRQFGVVCGDAEGTDNDLRRLSAMLYLSSKEWDATTCGGGVTMEGGESVGAVRDRILLLRSDTCTHRPEPWKGNENNEEAGVITVHFVKDSL